MDPKAQHFLTPLLTAVAIIGAGHRRNNSGVSDLFLDHRSKVPAVGGVAPRQHQRGSNNCTKLAVGIRFIDIARALQRGPGRKTHRRRLRRGLDLQILPHEMPAAQRH
jgi:hypothetical protein